MQNADLYKNEVHGVKVIVKYSRLVYKRRISTPGMEIMKVYETPKIAFKNKNHIFIKTKIPKRKIIRSSCHQESDLHYTQNSGRGFSLISQPKR